MKYKILNDAVKERTFALIFDQGDEVKQVLEGFVKEQNVRAANFSAVGAFEDVTLGWFDWEKKDYKKIPVREQVEVLSLLGDVSVDEGKPKVHAHVVVGTSEGNARGGHLMEAHVRPTLELFLRETSTMLRRAYDPRAQIDLITI